MAILGTAILGTILGTVYYSLINGVRVIQYFS
ncbi:hypothetical protein MNBD_ALPHA01-2436 [hydrothermal vent metagenome]|uniref:Uncharacterized protein n=1 Tax=hydrothermal vent metagenome TaxID=652676 RepID=A0A3B0STG1_9ZZZZ